MSNDEQAIRDVITEWMSASAAGDIARVLNLMAEDVVFLLPGRPPMRGREAFAAASAQNEKTMDIDGKVDIQEIQVAGDIAYCWNYLTITITPLQGGAVMQRTGHTLSIFPGRFVVPYHFCIGISRSSAHTGFLHCFYHFRMLEKCLCAIDVLNSVDNEYLVRILKVAG